MSSSSVVEQTLAHFLLGFFISLYLRCVSAPRRHSAFLSFCACGPLPALRCTPKGRRQEGCGRRRMRRSMAEDVAYSKRRSGIINPSARGSKAGPMQAAVCPLPPPPLLLAPFACSAPPPPSPTCAVSIPCCQHIVHRCAVRCSYCLSGSPAEGTCDAVPHMPPAAELLAEPAVQSLMLAGIVSAVVGLTGCRRLFLSCWTFWSLDSPLAYRHIVGPCKPPSQPIARRLLFFFVHAVSSFLIFAYTY